MAVICRWFQIGAGVTKSFNQEDFEKRLAAPLRRFMRSIGSEVKQIIIVSNADLRFGLGEATDEFGCTPTKRALFVAFPNEMTNGFLRVVVDKEWGNNAGSAHALNTGWRSAIETNNVSHILSWNPELEMTSGILARMFAHMERHGLDFVGAYRQGYWRLYQWALAQNTACLYPIEVLQKMEGFSPENCDGNDNRTIELPAVGQVALAGMDDFDLALRFSKKTQRMPRWGMVGRADPFLWDVNFAPNTERARLLQKKIIRQPMMMEHLVKLHYPEISYNELLDEFFAHRHED
ncbi:MAG: hypothetical protein PHH40_01350 [Candidatus Moranbacteria bacterium]|nr:hypothetical protein [Candidatus Moranbacteria bacterium]